MRKTFFAAVIVVAVALIAVAQGHSKIQGTWYLDKVHSHYPAEYATEVITQHDNVVDISLTEEWPGHPNAPMKLHLNSLQRSNCGFEEVEVLPHNIGYVKFNAFPDPRICGRSFSICGTTVAAIRRWWHSFAATYLTGRLTSTTSTIVRMPAHRPGARCPPADSRVGLADRDNAARRWSPPWAAFWCR